MRKLFTTLLVACLFATPAWAANGSLSLNTSASTVRIGDTFSVAVKASSGNIAANTVGADITFPPDLLEAVSVSGTSVITIPIAKGVAANGLVSIQGGIQPAKVMNASPIGTIYFKALKSGTATISVAASSGIYADDGAGTDLLASRETTQISVIEAPPAYPPANQPPTTNIPAPPPAANTPASPPVTSTPANPPIPAPLPINGLEQQAATWWQNNKNFIAVGGSAALLILGIYSLIKSLLSLTKRAKK